MAQLLHPLLASALGTTSAGEGCRIGAGQRENRRWKLPAHAADMVCDARPHLDPILVPPIHFHPFRSASGWRCRFACGSGNDGEGLRQRPRRVSSRCRFSILSLRESLQATCTLVGGSRSFVGGLSCFTDVLHQVAASSLEVAPSQFLDKAQRLNHGCFLNLHIQLPGNAPLLISAEIAHIN